MATSNDIEPSAHLAALQQQTAELQEQERQLRQQILSAAQAAATQAGELPPDSHNTNAPAISQAVPALIAELSAIDVTSQTITSMQELQSLAKALQRELWAMDRAANADAASGVAADQTSSHLQVYLEGLDKALQHHAAIVDLAEAQALLPTGAVPPPIGEQGDAALAAADAAQAKLIASLRGMVASQLQRLAWPPPLADSSGPRGAPLPWTPLEQEPAPAAAGGLMKLLEALTQLQRAVQRSSFDAAASTEGLEEGPELWAVNAVASPLVERLKLHFAPGRPTSRLDKPEWLLNTVLQMVRVHAPALAPIQQALTGPLDDVPHTYWIPAEFARAMRTAVRGLLKEQMCPRLLEASQAEAGPLWLHLADELASFEAALAPMRGLPTPNPSEPLEVPLWAPGSCHEVLCMHEAWQAAWWAAESGEATRKLDQIWDSDLAWEPAPQVYDVLEDGQSRQPGLREEFWPPCCAEAALSAAVDCARRCAWLDDASERAAFAAATVQELLGRFLANMARQARTAEDFRDIAGAYWAPKLAGLVCAAHFLAHRLRLPAPPLLVVEAAAEEAGVPGPVTQLAGSCASFHRKWTLKLARAVAARFVAAVPRYLSRKGLEAFAATTFDGREASVSAALAPGISLLVADLQRMVGLLDAVLFQELWRAVAVATTRTLFNDVVTECFFCEQGAQQLATDTDALVGCFRPYTPRPSSHLRELVEASSLLLLDEAASADLQRCLESASHHAAGHATADANGNVSSSEAVLEARGIVRLQPDAVLALLARRLF